MFVESMVMDVPGSTSKQSHNYRAWKAWHNMLERCYSKKSITINPAYSGCTVVEEWHRFSNFKAWYDANYKPGYQLDKDLIKPGNKLYGPGTCIMVPQRINSLLLDSRASRGQYPIGVSYHKREHKYQAHLSLNGKKKHIGYFRTAGAAFDAWVSEKKMYLREVLREHSAVLDPKVVQVIEDQIANLEGRFTPGIAL